MDDSVPHKGTLTEQDYCRGGMQAALACDDDEGKLQEDVHSGKTQAAQSKFGEDGEGISAKSARDEGHTSDIDDSLVLWHTFSVSGAIFTFG